MSPADDERFPQPASFHHSAFPPERLRSEREATISVCVPAREEQRTIAGVVRPLVALRQRGVIDQVVVIDGSRDERTATIAERLGAEVHHEDDLLAEHGPTRGKGDAMWRSLSVLDGELVAFVDGDSDPFGEHFVCGVLGPLVCEPGIEYVKAFYRRPFREGGVELPSGGGRVTELTARPLLERFYPQLAAIRQPLAGEMAARRALLERLPWSAGYAVETALLIDIWREVGIEAIAQVDLDVRQNRHQPLESLGRMAAEVLAAVTVRLERDGRLEPEPAACAAAPLERPPIASLDRDRREVSSA